MSLSRDVIYRISDRYQKQVPNHTGLLNTDFLYAYGLMSRDIIKTYISKFFPAGNYAPYSPTKMRIEESAFPNKTKKLMLDLLRETSEHDNLSNTLRDMMLDCNIEKFDLKISRALKNFEKLKINPVTTLSETMPGVRELLGFSDVESEGDIQY